MTAMQLKDWLSPKGYGGGAKLAAGISKKVERPISRQLLRAYALGHATPPNDVVVAIKELTKGNVLQRDWIALAQSVGRTNMSPTGRPLKPHRNAKKKAPAKPRRKKEHFDLFSDRKKQLDDQREQKAAARSRRRQGRKSS